MEWTSFHVVASLYVLHFSLILLSVDRLFVFPDSGIFCDSSFVFEELLCLLLSYIKFLMVHHKSKNLLSVL